MSKANKFLKVNTKTQSQEASEYERFKEDPLIKVLYSKKGEEELRKRFNICKSQGMTF
jgi:hypothetical protein